MDLPQLRPGIRAQFAGNAHPYRLVAAEPSVPPATPVKHDPPPCPQWLARWMLGCVLAQFRRQLLTTALGYVEVDAPLQRRVVLLEQTRGHRLLQPCRRHILK